MILENENRVKLGINILNYSLSHKSHFRSREQPEEVTIQPDKGWNWQHKHVKYSF